MNYIHLVLKMLIASAFIFAWAERGLNLPLGILVAILFVFVAYDMIIKELNNEK